MKMKIIKSRIYLFVIISFSCLIGFYSERYDVMNRIIFNISNYYENKLKVETVVSERMIETALLPLILKTFEFQYLNIESPAGSICSIENDIIILDRVGKSYIFNENLKSAKVTNWPDIPMNRSEFLKSRYSNYEEHFRVHGMLCRATDNGYEIFASHEDYVGSEDSTHLVVDRLFIDGNLASNENSWERIFKSQPLKALNYFANGSGGRMLSLTKHSIILTIGDYNLDGVNDEHIVAQDDSSDFGKVIKIDLRDGSREIVAKGLRNPQGITRTENGRIIIAEQGPKGGDKIQFLEHGANFGWPLATYGTNYTAYNWPLSNSTGRIRDFDKPIFAWLPSPAISNLLSLGDFNERWNNDIVVASLKANNLYRVRLEGDRAVYSEPIWIGERVRDLTITKSKSIYLWTDTSKLIELTINKSLLNLNRREWSTVLQPSGLNCLTCHHIGSTVDSHPAPTLSKVLGRKIASDNYSAYSEALKSKNGVWDVETLRRYLRNPTQFAPGTKMPNQNLTERQIDEAIGFIKELD
jgi:hypothetical protein